MSLGEVTIRDVRGITVASITGEVDISNASTIGTQVIDSVVPEAAGAVVDLSTTTYLDSAGVRTLFELAHRLQSRRQQLRLVARNEAIVRRVLALTKLDERVPLDDEVDHAVNALTQPTH